MRLFSKRGYDPAVVRTALKQQHRVGHAEARQAWLASLERAAERRGMQVVEQVVLEARTEGLQLAPVPGRWAGVRRWSMQRADSARLYERVLNAEDPWVVALASDELVRRYHENDRVALTAVRMLLEEHPFAFAASPTGQQLFATLVSQAATARHAAMSAQHDAGEPGPAALDDRTRAAEGALLQVIQSGHEDVRSIPLLQAVIRLNPFVIGVVHFSFLLRTVQRFPSLLDAVGVIARARADLGVMLLEASAEIPEVHAFLQRGDVSPISNVG